MKKIITIAATIAAIASVSCTKEKNAIQNCYLPEATGLASISAQADFLSVGTRSSYTAMESTDLKIDRYDIAFFRGNDLVREISVNNAGITNGQIPDTTVTLPVGTYKVYVVANAYTAFGDQMIISDEQATCLEHFEFGSNPDNILWYLGQDAYDNDGNLVQAAVGEVVVTEGNTPGAAATANLRLKRRVARIHVNSITNRLPSGADMEVEAVYLSNISSMELLFSDFNYMTSYSRYFLQNLNGRHYWEDAHTGLLNNYSIGEVYYDEDSEENIMRTSNLAFKSIRRILNGGAAYSTPFNLYCYRNPGTAYKTADDDEWDLVGANQLEWWDGEAAPATQLVIAVGLGTDLGDSESRRTMVYYPITLSELFPDGIQPNYSYNLDITLNSLGSSDPSEHISYGVAGVTASVSNWSDGGTSTIEM